MQEVHKQLQKSQSQQASTALSTQDIDQCQTCCVKMVKPVCYAQEMMNLMDKQEFQSSSSLKTLHPFIDNEVLFRLGGRLQQCTLVYQKMYQMNLPSNPHFTQIVVSAEHIILHYAGPQHLIESLRD